MLPRVRRREQRLRDALRFIECCPQIYHYQGPTVILASIEQVVKRALEQHNKDLYRVQRPKTEE